MFVSEEQRVTLCYLPSCGTLSQYYTLRRIFVHGRRLAPKDQESVWKRVRYEEEGIQVAGVRGGESRRC